MEKQPEHTEYETSPSTESPGLSLITKLVLFGAIIGIALGYSRTRKGSVQEKSLA